MALDENLNNARRLADCCDLLLRADADTGYGNAMSVHFVVRAFEKAGVAALMFEDQVWPKRCGHMAGKSRASRPRRWCRRSKPRCDARHDPDFVIISRTDAAGTHGVDEAIRRLNLYAEAGADCMYADALMSKEDIAKVAKNVPKPLIVNMGLGMRTRKTTPLMSPKELQDIGVAVVSYPRLLIDRGAERHDERDGGIQGRSVGKEQLVARDDLQVSFDELNDLMGMKQLDELEKKYAGG